MDQEELNEQLGTVDQSLFCLMLIILSVLLSFRSVLIQREQLEAALAGDTQNAAPDLLPIRLTASALTVIALGFFFSLSLRVCRDAALGNDPAAQRSAGMNVWASLLVLAAALIRFCSASSELSCPAYITGACGCVPADPEPVRS